MKRFVILACLAIFLGQHKADDNNVGNQGQHNPQAQQSKANGSTPGQTATKTADQKPAGDADKNHSQPVSVTSIPKIATQPDEDWIMVVLTCLLTAVGIGGTVIAVKTLIHIKRQADTLEEHKTKFDELAKAANSNAEASILQVRAMQEQITEMSVQSTHMEGQLDQAKILAEAANGQLRQMQTQTRLAIRPFVGLDEGPDAIRDAAGQVAVFDPPKQPITIVGAFVPSGGAIDAGRIAKYNYGEGAYKDSPKNPN